jgi:hypothetical protein
MPCVVIFKTEMEGKWNTGHLKKPYTKLMSVTLSSRDSTMAVTLTPDFRLYKQPDISYQIKSDMNFIITLISILTSKGDHVLWGKDQEYIRQDNVISSSRTCIPEVLTSKLGTVILALYTYFILRIVTSSEEFVD